jgi:hypothetical protein
MTSASADITPSLRLSCEEFWRTYYAAMLQLHTSAGRTLQDPIRDRNLGTTRSRHIAVFERFWRRQLALALGVAESTVGPRRLRFRAYRSKGFDVCWPREGEPRILISIKSMQNAYRNLTNRIEEAIGDAAVLRLYNSNAVYGFFFFILNGRVASGQAEQGQSLRTSGARGVPPYLDLIEEGGDFFDLADIDRYRRPASARPTRARGRQDIIRVAELSLLDLLATGPTPQASIHYDGIAFAPTRIRRLRPDGEDPDVWEASLSEVDERLSPRLFLSRLLATARLREFIQ